MCVGSGMGVRDSVIMVLNDWSISMFCWKIESSLIILGVQELSQV